MLPLIHASSFISCLKLPAASSSVRLVRQITALDSDRHIAPKDRNLYVFAPFSTARKTAQLRHSTATQRQRQVVTCWTTTRWRCHTSNIRADVIFHRNLPESSRVFRLVHRLCKRFRLVSFVSGSACPLGRFLSTDKRKRRLYFDFGWAVEFSPHRLSSSSSSLDLRLIHRSTSPHLLIRPLPRPPNKDRSRRYRRSSRIQLSNVNVHSSLLLILP